MHFRNHVSNLFDQKKQYNRTDLKIYLNDCLLNGPDDPATHSIHTVSHPAHNKAQQDHWRYLAENPSRQADEILYFSSLNYRVIEAVAPESAGNLLKR